ncbi:MAG: hypothetical protein Ct9H300mP1_27240 [Planctomycetaceae bacterium]|nr:MAG: hypothetical protein Ct9H300mP1_27240 [Planctomycetaceae bacterium]
MLEQFGTMPCHHTFNATSPLISIGSGTRPFCQDPGAVAAPTAGLHLSEISSRSAANWAGIRTPDTPRRPGDFRPFPSRSSTTTSCFPEWCHLSSATCRALNAVKESHRGIVAVGTTVVRTLESAWAQGTLQPFDGHTDLFIRPGHNSTRRRVVDQFSFSAFDAFCPDLHFLWHRPGKEAYRTAVQTYRFYSYGSHAHPVGPKTRIGSILPPGESTLKNPGPGSPELPLTQGWRAR